ncbi:battenin [Oryzias latipes]|uniref:Battenin n=1 Tax=Oryzias latipes TaxID=8090 RepID=H2MRZ3_ORYLA|nr:battenin [Oryzias latipes]
MEAAESINADGRCTDRRNWAGFWILGLCNNFAYVVMLSAAHDILTKEESRNATISAPVSLVATSGVGNSSNGTNYDCNPVTTGAVLLADILPTLIIKFIAPVFIHKVPYGFRVLACVLVTVVSFLLVSFSSAMWQSILGVVFASLGAGLGELSFLSLSVFFKRNVLEGWGSGTGGAGVAGALLYSGLIQAGLSPRVTVLVMLVVPVSMLISYLYLLVPPPSLPQWSRNEIPYAAVGSEEEQGLTEESEEEEEEEEEERAPAVHGSSGSFIWREKRQVIKGLLKFMCPLALVYFAEYFINQGLLELLFFPNFFLSHADQYRWYQTIYQFGVFASRSSLHCVKIRRVWILTLLQVVNAVFLLLAVTFQFLPSAWLLFVIIFYEGLLGGAAYVNTFHFISKETESRHREFAMAASSVGDSFGIALAALAAFFVHQYFCSL